MSDTGVTQGEVMGPFIGLGGTGPYCFLRKKVAGEGWHLLLDLSQGLARARHMCHQDFTPDKHGMVMSSPDLLGNQHLGPLGLEQTLVDYDQPLCKVLPGRFLLYGLLCMVCSVRFPQLHAVLRLPALLFYGLSVKDRNKKAARTSSKIAQGCLL